MIQQKRLSHPLGSVKKKKDFERRASKRESIHRGCVMNVFDVIIGIEQIRHCYCTNKAF